MDNELYYEELTISEFFIDKNGDRHKIRTDSYGYRYVEKNGRSFLI